MLGALLGDAWAFFLLLGPSPVGCITVPKMRGAGRRQMLGAQRAPAVSIAHILQAFSIGRLQRQSIGRVNYSMAGSGTGYETDNDP